MSVISFRCDIVAAARRRRRGTDARQRLGFFMGAALTLVLPTAFYCAAVGRLWPLIVMGCNEVLGALLGLMLFRRPRGGFASCVPRTSAPTVPGAAPSGLKLAA